MRILILGSKGMLGTDLVKEFKGEELYAYDIDEIDITNETMVYEKISNIKPNYVINVAAYTDVDGAETNKEIAFKVNAKAVEFIAGACKRNNCILVHISTDYVFNGEKRGGYKEDDSKEPINEYGYSKSKGEDYLIKAMDKYYLIRTSWLFGRNGKNFVNAILKLVKEKPFLEVVDDQFGSPTYTKDLSKQIKYIIKTKLPFGIYHVTNSGYCSWFEFAKEILKQAKINKEIKHIKSEKLKRAAKRPTYSVLINTKLRNLRGWKEALKDYLGEING